MASFSTRTRYSRVMVSLAIHHAPYPADKNPGNIQLATSRWQHSKFSNIRQHPSNILKYPISILAIYQQRPSNIPATSQQHLSNTPNTISATFSNIQQNIHQNHACRILLDDAGMLLGCCWDVAGM